jgi:tRNA (cmo5U34)-methyltransferase
MKKSAKSQGDCAQTCHAPPEPRHTPVKPPSPADHFNGAAARAYDVRNQALLPIAECMHFLIRLGLRDLPRNSQALCVGVGTGAEILSLAQAFPQWTFVGVDPSAAMLEVARTRLSEAGVLARCQLIHGYGEDAPEGPFFDVALSILVAHFVKREERLTFYRNMTTRLKKGGCLVNTEISYDLDAPDFPDMMNNWAKVQELMGATPESIANLPHLLREMLGILSATETEDLLRQIGIQTPLRFFQAFMISGWLGRIG